MTKKALHIRFDTEELRAKFFDYISEEYKEGVEFLVDDFLADEFISNSENNHYWVKHDKASNRYSYKSINDFSPTIDEKASLMEARGIRNQVWVGDLIIEDAEAKEEN